MKRREGTRTLCQTTLPAVVQQSIIPFDHAFRRKRRVVVAIVFNYPDRGLRITDLLLLRYFAQADLYRKDVLIIDKVTFIVGGSETLTIFLPKLYFSSRIFQ